MAKGMIKVLESRISQMKEFDVNFIEDLQSLDAKVDALGLTYNIEEMSEDKSVRSHIRKRTQKVNNVVARFKRDLNKVIQEITDGGLE